MHGIVSLILFVAQYTAEWHQTSLWFEYLSWYSIVASHFLANLLFLIFCCVFVRSIEIRMNLRWNKYSADWWIDKQQADYLNSASYNFALFLSASSVHFCPYSLFIWLNWTPNASFCATWYLFVEWTSNEQDDVNVNGFPFKWSAIRFFSVSSLRFEFLWPFRVVTSSIKQVKYA